MNWNVTLGDGSVRDVLYWPEIADARRLRQGQGRQSDPLPVRRPLL